MAKNRMVPQLLPDLGELCSLHLAAEGEQVSPDSQGMFFHGGVLIKTCFFPWVTCLRCVQTLALQHNWTLLPKLK